MPKFKSYWTKTYYASGMEKVEAVEEYEAKQK